MFKITEYRLTGPIVLMFLTAVLATAAVAGQITLPHTFVDGTVAHASQVNENFDALAAESNAQDQRIASIEGGLDLQLEVSQGIASPGGTGDAFISIAVNSPEGPVTGLSLSDFSFLNPFVPPGGSSIGINLLSSLPLLGTYYARVSPTTAVWREGTYLFFLQVTTGDGTDIATGKVVIQP